MEKSNGKDKCPLCHRTMPVVQLDNHVNSHLDAEEIERDRAYAQKIASTRDEPMPKPKLKTRISKTDKCQYSVKCDRGCNQVVPIQEWESHCLQHKLALQETSGNEECMSKRPRSISYGEGEQWKSNKITSKSLEENVRYLMSCQMKEKTTVPVREGLMHLLEKCLEADHRKGSSTIALSGWMEHYESRHREDLGWGCGWRNIQMLASYLLVADQDARDVLFGGCGFVPDILSLQRWVEVAWSKGFDSPGADYFNWEIGGTQKWIGTTECAALLRSFGLRARIVDFQSFGSGNVESSRGEEQDSSAEPTRSSTMSWKTPDSGSSSEVQSSSTSRSRSTSRSTSRSRLSSPVNNEDLECTGCGEYPIQGMRYRHSDIVHSDLCVVCMEKLRNSSNQHDQDVAKKYEGVDSEPASSSRNRNDADASRHQHIVDWVWNYFMERSNKATSATSAFDRLRQPIVFSKRSPLYFQHRGHSRTIVGIEKRWRPGVSEEVYLIVLDPSQKTGDVIRALRDKSGWQRLLKRGIQTLKHAEYQICYVDPGLATGEEYEDLKVATQVCMKEISKMWSSFCNTEVRYAL
ncbi:uncharacterized protein [Physcomitrium patens]|uniref:UFSP1/2/DUB catalytic domain-containing protein n=1 Tax=Physcomitrium patens TaxID=3218 RepID=A0A7I4AER0_PHYPA